MNPKKSLPFLACWLALNCHAATYFIDKVGGSDGNAGTTTGAPFQHAPGDNLATGNAASTTLSPGDTVRIKGGQNYLITTAETISMNWSGTPANPITYDGNSDGTWGTGLAIITDNWAANEPVPPSNFHSAMASSSLVSNIVIRSIEFYGLGGSQTLPADPGHSLPPNPAIAINFSAGVNNGVVRDCKLHEIGYFWNTKPMDASSISGTGIQSIDFNGLVISNNLFMRMAIAIELVSSSLKTNATVVSNELFDSIGWGVDLAMLHAGSVENWINIWGNRFHDTPQLDFPSWTGYGDWFHTDTIFDRCDVFNCTKTNVFVHHNYFYATNQLSAGGTASIYITEGGNMEIYNNIFNHPNKGRMIYFVDGPMPGGGPQRVDIFNNTGLENFVNMVDIEGNGQDGTRPVQIINCTNNIWVDTATGGSNNRIVYINDSGNVNGVGWGTNHWHFDYDTYRSGNTAQTFFQDATAGSPNNGSGTPGLIVMNRNGWETHGSTNDPAFVNLVGSGPNLLANDFHLTSSSAAKGTGFNLSGIFTTDFDGSIRTVPWSMGAYDGSSNFNANILVTGSLTITGPTTIK